MITKYVKLNQFVPCTTYLLSSIYGFMRCTFRIDRLSPSVLRRRCGRSPKPVLLLSWVKSRGGCSSRSSRPKKMVKASVQVKPALNGGTRRKGRLELLRSVSSRWSRVSSKRGRAKWRLTSRTHAPGNGSAPLRQTGRDH